MTRLLNISVCLAVFLVPRVLSSEDHFDHSTTDSHDHESHEHDHDDHGDAGLAMVITVCAGFAAFIGAFSMFCIKPEQLGVVPIALGFVSGVVVYLTFINLIPECIELMDHAVNENGGDSESLPHFYALLCVLLGLLLSVALEKFIGHGHPHHDSEAPNAKLEDTASTGDSPNNGGDVEMTSEKPSDNQEHRDISSTSASFDDMAQPKNLSRLSYSIAFALVLHHLPEGIATFISLYYDFEFGLLVAFALAIHDIPSGICIAVPTYCATGSMKT